MSVTWLLENLKSVTGSKINYEHLYWSYFESFAAEGQKEVDKKKFGTLIHILFPSAVCPTGPAAEKTFHNLAWKDVPLVRLQDLDMVRQSVLHAADTEDFSAHITSETEDKLSVSLCTDVTSNGHRVFKDIEFHSLGKWKLLVAGVSVNLDALDVTDTFKFEDASVNTVLTVVYNVKLCGGAPTTMKIGSETWVQSGEKHLRMRSPSCKRVLLFQQTRSICCSLCRDVQRNRKKRKMADKYNGKQEIDEILMDIIDEKEEEAKKKSKKTESPAANGDPSSEDEDNVKANNSSSSDEGVEDDGVSPLKKKKKTKKKKVPTATLR